MEASVILQRLFNVACDELLEPCLSVGRRLVLTAHGGRGTADTCRRGGVASVVEEPPAARQGFPSVPIPNSQAPGTNDATIPLLTALTDRVAQLEEALHSLQRHPTLSNGIPSTQARTANRPKPTEISPCGTARPRGQESIILDDEPSSSEDETQGVHGDAATVLEFLAWGRLKDSDFAHANTCPIDLREPPIFGARNTSHVDDTLRLASSPLHDGRSFFVEQSHISQIQKGLPTRTQVFELFNFHNDWLLWLHSSWHGPSVKQALEEFYNVDQGKIDSSSVKLQRAALLFAILSASITCAKSEQVELWGFRKDLHGLLAKQWYRSAIDCLNAAMYQQNHNLYGVQAISTLTVCAHILGFSNTQSVLLASAVRIAQSLGLHRLRDETRHHQDLTNVKEMEAYVQRESGRRAWQQLVTQDWFSVPFSETYCVNPLHFTSVQPSNCNEDSMEILPHSSPTVTTYGNFLFEIASLMPKLQDKVCEAQTLHAKYEQVLSFDRKMRDLVTSELPSCLSSQSPIDSDWPCWVPLAQRSLTITSAHKIIMIHRRFIGLSFTDDRFEFTRRTCLAAAKTIINELKKELPDGSPFLWTMQAFGVAAAIILSLDNFNRHQKTREYIENRSLVRQTITLLSTSSSISSISFRGIRLLTELLDEERKVRARDSERSRKRKRISSRMDNEHSAKEKGSRSLNVAAFVRNFCESDRPQAPHLPPIAGTREALWLRDNSFRPSTEHPRTTETAHFRPDAGAHSHPSISMKSPPTPQSENIRTGFSTRMTKEQQHDIFASPFGQNFTGSFDIRNFNWFDNLLGLAPSHSI